MLATSVYDEADDDDDDDDLLNWLSGYFDAGGQLKASGLSAQELMMKLLVVYAVYVLRRWLMSVLACFFSHAIRIGLLFDRMIDIIPLIIVVVVGSLGLVVISRAHVCVCMCPNEPPREHMEECVTGIWLQFVVRMAVIGIITRARKKLVTIMPAGSHVFVYSLLWKRGG